MRNLWGQSQPLTPTNKILIAETAASCARVGVALMRGLELV